jgi:hypothetical protein
LEDNQYDIELGNVFGGSFTYGSGELYAAVANLFNPSFTMRFKNGEDGFVIGVGLI